MWGTQPFCPWCCRGDWRCPWRPGCTDTCKPSLLSLSLSLTGVLWYLDVQQTRCNLTLPRPPSHWAGRYGGGGSDGSTCLSRPTAAHTNTTGYCEHNCHQTTLGSGWNSDGSGWLSLLLAINWSLVQCRTDSVHGNLSRPTPSHSIIIILLGFQSSRYLNILSVFVSPYDVANIYQIFHKYFII